MKTQKWWKYFANTPTGVSLTVSVPHAESSATAKLYPQGKIRVSLTQATAAHAASATISTPVAFRVTGIVGQSVSATSSGKVLGVYNDTTAIGTVSVGTANVSAAAAIDQTEAAFAVDADDLLVTLSGSSAGSAIVILDIVFT